MIICGLGSNVGDRVSYLQQAISRLSSIIQDVRLSSIYESEALLPHGAPPEWNRPFLNMALAGRTSLTAHGFLDQIKSMELSLGRCAKGKWGPREIDIDILAMDDNIISSEHIRIPHPELFNRDFALLPFAELAPDWKNPVQGAYYSWRASDIARDKGFGPCAALQRTEITLHV